MDWLPTLQKLNFCFMILFSAASSTTKLSLIWFCRRLIGAGGKGLYRGYNIFLIASMVFIGICWVLFEVVSLAQCRYVHFFSLRQYLWRLLTPMPRPMSAIWDLDPKYPHSCINDGAAVFSASIVNVFNDLLCTVAPMPLVWNLKLPIRQRLAVMSIFGLGAIVNVAGTVRTVYVYKSMLGTYDMTWWGWPILLSGTIEINLGLICASAPALRPLLSAALPRLLDTTRHYYSSSSKRASKLWSPGPSKGSNAVTSQVDADIEAHGGIDSRVHVLRTVELESWTEPSQVGMARTCDNDDNDEKGNNTTILETGQVVDNDTTPPRSSSGSTTIQGSQPRSPLKKDFIFR